MIFTKRSHLLAGAFVWACASTAAAVHAQETPAPDTPSPAPTAVGAATAVPAGAQMTFMDRAYDGKVHVTLAPYVWLPQVRTNLQYTIPTLRQRAGGTVASSVTVGPSDYLSKINSAALFAFDVRMGTVSLLGDYIYTNVSSSASTSRTITGPFRHVSIPISFTTSARLASSIWELAAGPTLAHGHDADLNFLVGWRQFPLNFTDSYAAVIGKRGIIAPSGTIVTKELASDVIFALQGKAFFGDGHWFVPYYADIGAGYNNDTWEGFTGAGYTFNHGQALLFTWRSLNYYAFPSSSPIRKLTMSGPLLGYTFGL